MATAGALTFSTAGARADLTKAECIDANTQGQDLQREGKLAAARAQFRICGTPSCPALVRADCTKRLDDVEKAQPVIVFDAKDGAGHDVSSVSVTMDGEPLAERLDGTPLQVDPGQHVFVFTMPNQPPLTQTFVLREGDKERRERIVIGQIVPMVAVPSRTASLLSSTGGPPSAVPSRARPQTQQVVLGVVTGAVGIAGVAVGTVWSAMTLSERERQQTDCASPTNCPNHAQALSDHAAATADRTIATIGFIAGGALLVTSAVLFFTAAPSAEPEAHAGMVVRPSVGPGSAGVSWSGEF